MTYALRAASFVAALTFQIPSVWPDDFESLFTCPGELPPSAPLRAPAPPAPVKTWVWLRSQRCYGYGYRRPDGLWVIDSGTKVYPRVVQSPVPYGQASFYGPAPVSGVAGGCAGGTCGISR